VTRAKGVKEINRRSESSQISSIELKERERVVAEPDGEIIKR
jgi:hypothetical protein